MYIDYMDLLSSITLDMLIKCLLVIAFIVMVKWIFYYTIVKSGTTNAIEDTLAKQNDRIRAQQYELQRRLQEQQIEIQRLQAMLREQGK